MTFSKEELAIKSPARIFCAGPSGSGKTTFVQQLICSKENIFDRPIRQIVYFYGSYQPVFDVIKICSEYPIKFISGLKSLQNTSFTNPKFHDLIVIDDLMEEVTKSDLFLQLCTKFSHHWNCSLLFLTQNAFFQCKKMRTCSLQATGFILFNTLRGRDQINYLSRQLFPSKPGFLLQAFNDATMQQYGYLFINFHPACDEMLRVRGNIMPPGFLTFYH